MYIYTCPYRTILSGSGRILSRVQTDPGGIEVPGGSDHLRPWTYGHANEAFAPLPLGEDDAGKHDGCDTRSEQSGSDGQVVPSAFHVVPEHMRFSVKKARNDGSCHVGSPKGSHYDTDGTPLFSRRSVKFIVPISSGPPCQWRKSSNDYL